MVKFLFQKGHIVSDETRKKISDALLKRKHDLGHINSPITRKRMSLAKKGVPCSNGFKKGEPSWNKGKRTGFLSKRPFETRRKLSEAHKGAKSCLWKGGITAINTSIRHSQRYREWRNSIFERDLFTCQICRVVGKKLNVDHFPKTFAELIKENRIKSVDDAMACDELWNISENRTLCVDCHKLTPTYLNGAYLKVKV